MPLGKLIQPVQELFSLVVALAAHNLGEAVDEDMGNVVVAGIHTADKALQRGIVSDVVLAGLYQADVVMDVEGQLVAFLNADHIAVLGLNGVVDHLDHVLGLAGALLAHDNANHVYHSLSI